MIIRNIIIVIIIILIVYWANKQRNIGQESNNSDKARLELLKKEVKEAEEKKRLAQQRVLTVEEQIRADMKNANRAVEAAEKRAANAKDTVDKLKAEYNKLETEQNNKMEASKDELDMLRKQNAGIEAAKASRNEPITDKDIIEYTRKKLGFDLNKKHILITGDSGSGKSFFIKYLLGYKTNESGEHIPEVGFESSITELKKYSSDKIKYIIWDSPGIGTQEFPTFDEYDKNKHYYRQFHVYAFDLVIIFYSNRLNEGATTLLELCHSAKQPVILVRNKMDSVVKDLEHNYSLSEDDAIKNAKETVINETQQYIDMGIPVFMISVYNMIDEKTRFDEDRLLKYISDFISK